LSERAETRINFFSGVPSNICVNISPNIFCIMSGRGRGHVDRFLNGLCTGGMDYKGWPLQVILNEPFCVKSNFFR
jgi:hypothetical protein